MATVIVVLRYYYERTSIFASHWENYSTIGEQITTVRSLEYFINLGYSVLGQSSCLRPDGATTITWVLST